MVTFKELNNTEWGRLGNQLFQIASTIGIADQNGQHVVFPEWAYNSYLKSKVQSGCVEGTTDISYLGSPYREIKIPKGNWNLNGFFTSEKYFNNIDGQIRSQFKPSDSVSEYINNKYGHLLSQGPCSIHVRRGDYLNLSWDFPAQTIEYFNFAISLMPEGTKFMVFSDDINWCKENFTEPNFCFVEGEKDIIDVFTMSLCKNHIISNSTLGWWGAWLNPSKSKRVFCPALWYGPGVTSRPFEYTKDLYPANFTAILPPNYNRSLIQIRYLTLHVFYNIWSKIYNRAMKLLKKKNIDIYIKLILGKSKLF